MAESNSSRPAGDGQKVSITDLDARRFGKGDESAEARVRARVERILAYRGFGIPAEDRRDLEQEIVTELWQLTQRPGAGLDRRFWGLVETVTSRRCIDWLRRSRRHEQLDPALAAEENPLADTLDRERHRLAAAALGRLSSDCRKLISLQVGQGMSYREIAALLHRSEGALRVQMYRCIREARRVLEDLAASDGSSRPVSGGEM